MGKDVINNKVPFSCVRITIYHEARECIYYFKEMKCLV